jgi:Domain of unknown function DUF11
LGLRKLLGLTFAVIAVGAIAPSSSLAAATFTVNTTMDTNAVNPAVSPMDSGGNISLRSVLEYVNTVPPGATTINVPAGTYTLTTEGGAGQGTQGALVVGTDVPVDIVGAGPSSTTIDANFLDRVLQVSAGPVTISGFTIENGRPAQVGSSTSCPGSLSGPASGGGILDSGTLTLMGDTITGNLSPGNGGGIEETGTGVLKVIDSTVSHNTACAGDSSSTPGAGGGIDESGGGTVVVRHSTISHNTAIADGGGVADSSGIAPVQPPPGGTGKAPPNTSVTITGSTIEHNTANGNGGGVVGDGPVETNAPADLTLFADLVTGNTSNGTGGGVAGNDVTSIVDTTVAHNTAAGGVGGIDSGFRVFTISFSTINANRSTSQGVGNLDACGDCGGGMTIDDSIVAWGVGTPNNCGQFAGIVSKGHNIFSDTESGCNATSSDQVSTNPNLTTLADNGGPTETEALMAGSPAIDAASVSRCASETKNGSGNPVDQREFVPRPQGVRCDIGAFETTPDLGITASPQNQSILVGQQATVTDVIQNTGPPGATDSTFTDPGSGAGYQFDSVSSSEAQCSHTATTAKCDLGLVPSGGKVTITLVLTGLTPGTIKLNSSTATSGLDLNQSNNAAAVGIDVKAIPPPPPPPPPKPKPSIAVAKLGPACYAPHSMITIKTTARAVAAIRTVTVKLGGKKIGFYKSHPVAPTVKKVTLRVHASNLKTGHTYAVSATVVDLLGRSAHASSHLTVCKPKPKRGFTG